MRMEVLEFGERIKSQRERFLKETEFQSDCQKKIDFVRFNSWLINNPKVEAKCDVTIAYYKCLTFHFSNTSIEDFIEHILGPYHLKFKANWKLTLEGSEDDPVFVFSDIRHAFFNYIEFRVKEGEFTSCKFVSEFSHTTKVEQPSAVYNLKMICE